MRHTAHRPRSDRRTPAPGKTKGSLSSGRKPGPYTTSWFEQATTRLVRSEIVGQQGNPAIGDRHDAADQSRLGRLGEGHGAVGVGDKRPAPEVGHLTNHLDIRRGHGVARSGTRHLSSGLWDRELHLRASRRLRSGFHIVSFVLNNSSTRTLSRRQTTTGIAGLIGVLGRRTGEFLSWRGHTTGAGHGVQQWSSSRGYPQWSLARVRSRYAFSATHETRALSEVGRNVQANWSTLLKKAIERGELERPRQRKTRSACSTGGNRRRRPTGKSMRTGGPSPST